MTQLEQPRMVTPEAVALDFTTANVGSRSLAYLIDVVIVSVVSLGGLLAVGLGQPAITGWLVIAIFIILMPGWYFGYFVASETLWNGRTVGKAALGLRVVTKEGGPVRFRHAAVRTVLGLVDFGIGGGFFAIVFILFTPDNQRLGDLLAGTLVLRERSGLPAPAPVSFGVPPGLEPYTATLDISGLRIEEYQAVRTFLLRAPSLPPAPRTSLATQLASPLVERLRPPPPPGVPPELFLNCVAAAYQRRQRPAGGPGPAGPTPPPTAWPPPTQPVGGWPGMPPPAPPPSWPPGPATNSARPAEAPVPGAWPGPPGPGPAPAARGGGSGADGAAAVEDGFQPPE